MKEKGAGISDPEAVGLVDMMVPKIKGKPGVCTLPPHKTIHKGVGFCCSPVAHKGGWGLAQTFPLVLRVGDLIVWSRQLRRDEGQLVNQGSLSGIERGHAILSFR